MNHNTTYAFNESGDTKTRIQCTEQMLDKAMKAYIRAKPFTNGFASEKSISSADLITVAFHAYQCYLMRD